MRKNIVSVIVSNAPEYDDKELATYSCEDCGNLTAVQSSLSEPFCISCGSGELEKVDDGSETEMDFESEDDLVSAKCVECKQYNIFTKDTYSSLNEDGVVSIHCPVCAKENKWSDTGQDNIFVASSKEGRILCKKHDEDELAHITCDSCNEDAIMTLDYAKEHASSSGVGTVQCPSCLEDIVFKEATFADDHGEDDNGGNSIDDFADGDEDDDDDDTKESDIDDTGDANIQNVDLVKSSNQVLYAIADDSIIAKLSVADKSESEIDALSKALVLSFKDKDVTDVLIDNGFGIIDESNNTFVNVADIKSQMDENIGKNREVIYQSLGIAACGINRKWFQEDNPLHVSLVQNLSDHMSEDEADAIVAKAFIESSDDYVELLREQTKEIANKSDEVRNELSKTIMGTSLPTPVVSKTASNNVENRLLQPVEGQRASVTASKYKGNSKVVAIARNRGGPLFPQVHAVR